MKQCWQAHQAAHAETAPIIGEGLQKLEEYRTLISAVPVYMLATSALQCPDRLYLESSLWSY